MARRPTNVRPEPRPHPILEQHFPRWTDFKAAFAAELFSDGLFRRGRYLFRGHADASWRLESTFDRAFKNHSKAVRLTIANKLIAHFRQFLEEQRLALDVLDNEQRLLALGQHFGLPTRLLDWSESPYVAAFFAFHNTALWGASDSNVVIWALDTEHAIWSREYGVEIVDGSTLGNDRIRNQSGRFTLSRTPYANLEEYVAAHGDGGHPLRRFLLPAREARAVLADLESMRIHHATVYPEVSGCAYAALFRAVVEVNAHTSSEATRAT
ncbi:MAG: FRG domain-containing protein [Planctomycetes bacterium]|nr:FRG domain-containing protein [Planctomycetota bacterium]